MSKTLAPTCRAAQFAMLVVLMLGGRAARGESAGSIVGWGGRVLVPQSALTNIVAVAAGAEHNLALRAGTIVAWGRNVRWDSNCGQCDVPAPNVGFVGVAGGGFHSLGLKADGSIVAWGENRHGECDVPAPNAGFVALAGGGAHSLALRADGSIAAWGRNEYGQCALPAPNAGFVAVAAGWLHGLGLKADGSVVAWGANWEGQCDVPAPNTGFVAVAAGYSHSLGLKANVSIVAWGYNGHGECDVPAPNSDVVALAASATGEVDDGAPPHSLGLPPPGCVFSHCDVNGNGSVGFDDIDPFVARIPSMCPQADCRQVTIR